MADNGVNSLNANMCFGGRAHYTSMRSFGGNLAIMPLKHIVQQ